MIRNNHTAQWEHQWHGVEWQWQPTKSTDKRNLIRNENIKTGMPDAPPTASLADWSGGDKSSWNLRLSMLSYPLYPTFESLRSGTIQMQNNFSEMHKTGRSCQVYTWLRLPGQQCWRVSSHTYSDWYLVFTFLVESTFNYRMAPR